MKHPFVLTIAGFDPCGGAGVLADCKTIEALAGSGLAVISGLTVQNEREVRHVAWRSSGDVRGDLECLADCYTPAAVKIGIVANAAMLREICRFVADTWPHAPVVWDPVLRATAGEQFFEGAVEDLPWKEITLITPNREELLWLARERDGRRALAKLSVSVAVYAKSYKTEGDTISNRYCSGDVEVPFKIAALAGYAKHGSGCVLSAAIATGLAAGQDILEAIECAEVYMRSFLTSAEGLLGRHGTCV